VLSDARSVERSSAVTLCTLETDAVDLAATPVDTGGLSARQGPCRDAGLVDAYDAAVVERRERGKTKIVKKHETRRARAVFRVAESGSRPV
jgi:hypothetical protein